MRRKCILGRSGRHRGHGLQASRSPDLERKLSGGLARAGAVAIVAFKVLKSSKILLALASLVTYSFMMTWRVAIVFLLGLVIHECGHVWAMRRCGIQTKGFYLIPFVGGVCSPERPFENRQEEAFIAAMGPVFGLAATPLCLLAGLLLEWGDIHTAANAASMCVFVNLFNLLPIVPMDGGRILRSIVSSLNRTLGFSLIIFGVAFSLYLAWSLDSEILGVVALFGVMEAVNERRRGGRIAAMPPTRAAAWMVAYLGLIGLAVAGGAVCLTMSGDPRLTEIILSL